VIEAVQVCAYGGPEILEASERQPRRPGPGQIQVAVAAAGVNFINVYQRSGRAGYAIDTPFVPALEGAGQVTAAGPAAGEFVVGDRVAGNLARGCYAEQVLVDAWQAVHCRTR
jgi:NADPH:quinone reductase